MAKIQRKGEMIFWLMVFGAILLHHQSVFFYFDDYAYATLSYSVAVPGVTGTNYGLLDILSFCILHWWQWGGRVLFYFFYILASHIGLWMIRLVQSVVITLILYYSSQLAQKAENTLAKIVSVGIPVISFLLIQQPVHQDGTYWFAAAAGYVWPFVVLFPTVKCYSSHLSGFSARQKVLLLLGAFCAGFSQEQTALVTCIAIGAVSVEKMIRQHKAFWFDFAMIISSGLGAAMVLLAPGNQKRNELVHGVVDPAYNLPFWMRYFFSENTFLFMSILAIAFGGMSYILVCRSQKKWLKGFWSICCVLWTGSAVVMLVTQKGLFDLFNQALGLNELACDIILGLLMVWMVITSVMFYFFAENRAILFLFLGGGACAIAMLFSPTLPLRLVLPFFISAIPLITNAFTCAMSEMPSVKKIVVGIACVFFVAGSINALNIFQGYRSNAIVLRENDQTMRQTAQIYKETNQLEGAIVLKNVPNEAYAGCLPSEEGTEWYLSYYGLPENTELVFR